MNKLLLNAHKERIEYLKEMGFPECNKVPMTKSEIENLKIGMSCYVISQAGLHLRMYFGASIDNSLIYFTGDTGNYSYKLKNIGKTFNVFRAEI